MRNNRLTYDKQIEYEGNSYLDPKHMPMDSFSALTQISLDSVFDGIEMTIISDENWSGNTTSYAYKNNAWNLNNATVEIYDERFITFTALENNSQIGLAKISSNQTLEYSNNTKTWMNFTTAVTITLSSGQSVYIRGVLSGDNTNTDETQFKTPSGRFNISGNINSLWNYEDLEQPLYNFCGSRLFKNCNGIINVFNLKFPSLILSDNCYQGMFQECGGLTTAPKILPATTLSNRCYFNMFSDCTSLTVIPKVLPSMSLSNECYCQMFCACTSLTTIPYNMLPATTLAHACYYYMFGECTNLTDLRNFNLPATTLADECYAATFISCSSLRIAPVVLPATALTNSCYWGMFGNCTKLVTPPELPSTQLANGCYMNMFQYCTTLSDAPILPATTLVTNCYASMFYGCSGLNHIKCLATSGINTNSSTGSWVNGVASSGTFVKHPNASNWPSGVNGIPSNWTVQNNSN